MFDAAGGGDDSHRFAPNSIKGRSKQRDDGDASSGPLAMHNWQQPDRRQTRLRIDNNIGADVAIGLAQAAMG